jgi:hypothetical protein
MRLIVVCALLSLNITASAEDEPSVPSADDWYKSEYAPLYLDKPWDRLDELMEHFAETIRVHDGDSVDGVVNSREWLGGALQEWKIEGWLRSELAEYQSDHLNLHAVSFKVKWRDYYSGGNVGYECGWYLANLKDDKWMITGYATISCRDHGM